MKVANHLEEFLKQFPSPAYLGIAVLIFAASNSLTRKIVEIGQAHLIDGRNPISLCNVLFVGNLCALGLMSLIFHQDWKLKKLKTISRQDWIGLTVTGILSGGIAPALMFTALGQANVTNVVLIGRLEPLLILALSVWFLGIRLDHWTVAGSLISFAGIVVTVSLGSSGQNSAIAGFQIGTGELLVAIAAVIGAISSVTNKLQLQTIPLGIFSIYRNILGTILFFLLANILYGPEHFIDVLSPFLWQWMLLYAAVIVVMGKLCWFAGLKKATSTELNMANLLNPILAIFMAYLILGEKPTFAQYCGGILLLIGFVLSLIGNRTQISKTPRLEKSNPREAMEMFMGFRGV
jgi:drug/metabolite transporter (DMT)-like permease